MAKKNNKNSEDQFIPDKHDLRQKMPLDKKQKMKRLKRRQAAIDRCQNYCQGAWSIEENKIYLDFLTLNKDLFLNQHIRRSHRVFDILSRLLPKRTAEQCRSHHQKIEQLSGSNKVESVISYFRDRISRKHQISLERTSQEYYEKMKQKGYYIEQFQNEIIISIYPQCAGFEQNE